MRQRVMNGENYLSRRKLNCGQEGIYFGKRGIYLEVKAVPEMTVVKFCVFWIGVWDQRIWNC